eukprot:CAMPEP_0205944036 /NCGR_PEP_ID=MMETSP1325-20131115/62081_1 /ASSEMBLY_ACC=CAM_ASM_000708 /TAXON_ID=236786 /ORGANISM="Florenciella sp., Strain RCC1007" /LENGTH=92 /DNA_ID=CAMNT_0053314893 /DNA_START=5 /DNA_END=280 /DNA_ORIENTATION=+
MTGAPAPFPPPVTAALVPVPASPAAVAFLAAFALDDNLTVPFGFTALLLSSTTTILSSFFESFGSSLAAASFRARNSISLAALCTRSFSDAA